MFEDFSFLTASSTITSDPQYARTTSVELLDPLSPLSSQCASPTTPNYPRTHDLIRGRFAASRTPSIDLVTSPSSRRVSIDSLTSQFDSHSPFDATTGGGDRGLPPRSTPMDEDEGFDEPAYNHISCPNMDYQDLLTPPLSALEHSLGGLVSGSSISRPLSFATRRRHRQLLSRLQCLSEGRMDAHLNMLLEECHPSSLPADLSDSDRDTSIPPSGGSAAGNRLTATVITSGRIEKARAVVQRAPRLRRRKH